MSNELTTVQAGQTARQDFSGAELTTRGETAAVAVAAQAKAAVEARYILALKKPREWEDVRVRLEKECRRPGFAEAALYRKPIGKGVEGLSIRFAEAALRCMTNCYPETSIIFESESQRIIQVSVTDLEANLTYSSQIVIDKTVERKSVKEGQEVLGKRTNSYGETTYQVRATEDDLLNKQNALISKALRTNALRLLPGDITDGCEAIIRKTKNDRAAADPDGERKLIVDSFAAIGVGPVDLSAWLRHSLERIQPAEIVELRGIYTAIRDGEATWEAVMEARGITGSAEQQEDVREKMAQRRGFAAASLADAKEQEGSTPAEASTVAGPQCSEKGEASGDEPQPVAAGRASDSQSAKKLTFGRK